MASYYCIKCGRPHREDSGAGRAHKALDPTFDYLNFTPEEFAVGLAMARASQDTHSGNTAALGDVEMYFKELGFREQFPNLDVERMLNEWADDHIIGRDKYSGRQWYDFLANDWDTPFGIYASRMGGTLRSKLSRFERMQKR